MTAKKWLLQKSLKENVAGKHIYNVLNNFEYKNNKYSYIECKLETGRTHQIRVHMSYIGHPLLSAMPVYGYSKQAF